jgi:hypothetical protein
MSELFLACLACQIPLTRTCGAARPVGNNSNFDMDKLILIIIAKKPQYSLNMYNSLVVYTTNSSDRINMRINIFIMGLLALEQRNGGGSRPARTTTVTEPPKVLGPPTVVLVLRTLDNPVDAHNHLTSLVLYLHHSVQERFTRHADITSHRRKE